jgi:hypothetical protein
MAGAIVDAPSQIGLMEETMLTAGQRERYQKDGFIVVERALTPAASSRVHAASSPTIPLTISRTATRPMRRIKAPHKVDPFFGGLVRSAGILQPVKDLLGPSVRFLNSKLNMKSAGYGAAVELHQDWAFYPYTNDDVLAVGVMLDDVTLDNGPMLVLPGSHRGASLRPQCRRPLLRRLRSRGGGPRRLRRQPRLAAVPVRMPQPGAFDPSSIYASQKSLERRSFAVA